LGAIRKRHSIGLVDPPDVMRDAIMNAVTDSTREVRPERLSPGIINLLTIYELLAHQGREAALAEFAGKGYAVLKRVVADVVVKTFEPVRRQYLEMVADPGKVDALLDEGADRARAIAGPTLDQVKELVGVAAADRYGKIPSSR
jgi:tryptophanyl-tRNA synthetase